MEGQLASVELWVSESMQGRFFGILHIDSYKEYDWIIALLCNVQASLSMHRDTQDNPFS